MYPLFLKTLMVVLPCCFCFNSSAQWYIGAQLGLGFGPEINENGEKIGYIPQSFLFSMPVSYRLNNWLFELNGQYAGATIASLTAGRVFPISDKCDFQFLAGLADNLLISKKPLQIIQEFSYNITGRLQLGDFMLQLTQIQRNTYIGVGFRGLMFQTY